MRDITVQLCREGYQVQNILNYLKIKTFESTLNDKQKATIILELCNTDKRLIESGDEFLQILNILSLINQVAKGNIC